MTIGANSNRLLTVNASPTFNAGLTVASGAVSFPANSINASSIANLPTGISLSNANTWTQLQTFNNGINVNGTINIPSNSLQMGMINGLNTQLTTLQSSITSQLSNYCLQSNYTTLKAQADAISLLLTNTQYIDGFGLNWYGNMNVFGSLIVTINGNNYLNVGTLLNALPSTYVSNTSLTQTLNSYATNTSLTQTLNSYATNTYVDGKVSLSSNTIPALTSTQIGYQVSTTTCLKATTDSFNNVVTLATLSGLTPVGSVWIVETSVQQNSTSNGNLLNYFIEVQEGNTYASNSGNINGVNIITIGHGYNPSGQTAAKEKGTVDSGSAVYVVSSKNTTGYLCLGGSFTSTTSIAGILLRATRIA